MPWWIPEESEKEYQETFEFAKKAVKNPSRGAFGRFSGRPKGVYTINELMVKYWLDRHGLKYYHNYRFPDPMWPSGMEMDFYVPAVALHISVDPMFHVKGGHPVVRHVAFNDEYKEEFLKHHGVHTVHLIAYENAERFAEELDSKLSGMLP